MLLIGNLETKINEYLQIRKRFFQDTINAKTIFHTFLNNSGVDFFNPQNSSRHLWRRSVMWWKLAAASVGTSGVQATYFSDP